MDASKTNQEQIFCCSQQDLSLASPSDAHEEKIAFVKALTKVVPYGVVLIDFLRHEVVFSSSDILTLWNSKKCTSQPPSSYVHLLQDSESAILGNVFRAYQELLNTLSNEEAMDTALIFDLKLTIGKSHERIVHHRVTPLSLLPTGEMWYGLGILSPSVNRDSGNVIVHQKNSIGLYCFDSSTSRWNNVMFPSLNTIEKEILVLSAQGFTVKQISEMLYRTVNGVKTAKQKIFRKLKVENIQEALTLLSHRFPI